MRVFQVLMFMLSVAISVHGQDKKSEERDKVYGIPNLSIKYSPLHLINLFPTVQLDAEVKIRDRMTVQAGGSPVIYMRETDHWYGLNNKRGYKLKSELRYYFVPVHPDDKKLFYLSLSFDYNRLKNDKTGTFGFDCGGWDCQYRQEVNVVERRIIYSLTHRIGLQRYLAPWFLLDINAGWGIRWGNYSRKNDPEGYDLYITGQEDTHEFELVGTDHVDTGVAIGLGVKLSVRIK